MTHIYAYEQLLEYQLSVARILKEIIYKIMAEKDASL